MKMKTFRPQGILEELVMKKDGSEELVEKILNGERLSRPDIFAEEKFFALPLMPALLLSLMGLPKAMRPQALSFTACRLGCDSEVHRFLEEEFASDDSPGEPCAGERRLFMAIVEKDELVVQALASYDPCYITTELPLSLLPALLALSSKTRKILFSRGFYAGALVRFFQKMDAHYRAMESSEKMDECSVLANEIIPVFFQEGYEDEDLESYGE